MASVSRTQPVDVLNIDNAQLKFATVVAVTGRSESTIRRAVAAGEFPAPRRYGAKCTRFLAKEVRAWLAAQGASA